MGGICEDLTGKIFGRITVIEQLPSKIVGTSKQRMWRGQCACGVYVEKTTWNIKNYTSCGCAQNEAVRKMVSKIKKGDRYGDWEVIEFVKKTHKTQTSQWKCVCRAIKENGEECGRKGRVRSYGLLHGRSKSCGCNSGIERVKTFRKKGIIKDKLTLKIRKRYWEYEKGAVSRGILFLLDWAIFKKLVLKPCFYCGVKPESEKRGFHGVDRVNNIDDYVTSNVVSCCTTCNRAKGTKSFMEYCGWLFHVSENLKNVKMEDMLVRVLKEKEPTISSRLFPS